MRQDELWTESLKEIRRVQIREAIAKAGLPSTEETIAHIERVLAKFRSSADSRSVTDAAFLRELGIEP